MGRNFVKTSPYEVLTNWKRQKSQNAECHRTRRLNLAKLNANSATLILKLNNAIAEGQLRSMEEICILQWSLLGNKAK